MNKLKIDVNPDELLKKVSRMFDNSGMSIVLEIAQNARRAGAKMLWIEEKKNSVTFYNDGVAIDDFQPMFSLGSTGWEDSKTLNEDPAGCGFFVATIFDEVIVRTRKDDHIAWVRATKEDLTTYMQELKVDEGKGEMPEYANTSITLVGNKDKRQDIFTWAAVDKNYGFQEVRALPIPVATKRLKNDKCDGEWKHTIPFKVKDKDIVHSREKNGLKYEVVSTSLHNIANSTHDKAVVLNYHGHVVTTNIAVETLNCEIYITPCGPNGVRLVLPSRSHLIENDAYNEIKTEALSVYAEAIATVGIASAPGVHYHSFKEFEILREHQPDIPEAEMPGWAWNFLIKTDDPEKDKQRSLNYVIGRGTISEYEISVVAQAGGVAERHRIDDYCGYSWLENMRVIRHDEDVQIEITKKDGLKVRDTAYNIYANHGMASNVADVNLYLNGERIPVDYIVILDDLCGDYPEPVIYYKDECIGNEKIAGDVWDAVEEFWTPNDDYDQATCGEQLETYINEIHSVVDSALLPSHMADLNSVRSAVTAARSILASNNMITGTHESFVLLTRHYDTDDSSCPRAHLSEKEKSTLCMEEKIDFIRSQELGEQAINMLLDIMSKEPPAKLETGDKDVLGEETAESDPVPNT